VIIIKGVRAVENREDKYKQVYTYLMSLREDDEFWDNTLGDFNKKVCFNGFICIEDYDDVTYEDWFKKHKPYINKISKLIWSNN
jgi:hypothetical protein